MFTGLRVNGLAADEQRWVMSQSRIRVLLVDDSAAFRSVLRLALRREPAINVVAEATNGRAAIDAAEYYQPDLVIMDVSMPVMNGIDATRVIRAAQPDMKVLVLTSSEEPIYRKMAADAGANAFLHKTTKSSAVLATILEMLRPPIGVK
jgi:DNA-binding NarL/FixJ family response regulator